MVLDWDNKLLAGVQIPCSLNSVPSLSYWALLAPIPLSDGVHENGSWPNPVLAMALSGGRRYYLPPTLLEANSFHCFLDELMKD